MKANCVPALTMCVLPLLSGAACTQSDAPGEAPRAPAAAPGQPETGSTEAPAADSLEPPGTAEPDLLVNRVWTRSDSAGRPGVIKVFLGDGTLLQDSCWETHRLSRWRREPDGTLLWQEDGADIRAAILTLAETALVLRLDLAGGPVEERFVTATAPYVCPDVPR